MSAPAFLRRAILTPLAPPGAVTSLVPPARTYFAETFAAPAHLPARVGPGANLGLPEAAEADQAPLMTDRECQLALRILVLRMAYMNRQMRLMTLLVASMFVFLLLSK